MQIIIIIKFTYQYFTEKTVCEVPPAAPSNGKQYHNETRLILAGAVVEYSCRNGWQMEGIDRKECAGNGTWVPEGEVKCVKMVKTE